jgi:hypothetical protein
VFFGTQHVALLLDDLVDALVLLAHLLDELLELRGIFNALRRELPYTAGGALDDQPRDPLRIVDQVERVGQVSGIGAKAGHGQYGGGVPRRRRANFRKINRAGIDELRHPLLRDQFDARRNGRRGTLAQARKLP